MRPIGLGLRFEFKHRMNIRIDYGFGKGTSGLVVQFAEGSEGVVQIELALLQVYAYVCKL